VELPETAPSRRPGGVNEAMSGEHDDWVKRYLGVDPQSYSPDGPRAAQAAPLQDVALDQQTAGQEPARPDPKQSAEADEPDLLLDPEGNMDTKKGFTKTPEEVEKDVTDKFGKFIPKKQLDDHASKVTNFQDDATFQKELNARHPDLAKQGIDPKTVMGESFEGKIFINKDKADVGTAYHEQMHHYSSSKFNDKFGASKFHEGVTEYFTRQLYSGDRSGHYDTQEATAKAVAKKVGEDVLKKAYFEGDEDAMKKVSDALAGK